MSAFPRFLKPFNRRYSSFFSSKSGSGRYFNSAKAPKSVVSQVIGNKHDAGVASKVTQSDDTAAPASNSTSPISSELAERTRPVAANGMPSFSSFQPRPLSHPVISAKDCTMHQFFSLHRPLILLSNPPSILASAPEPPSESSVLPSRVEYSHEQGAGMFFGATTASPVDADAETARQITRALTVNIVGGIHEWENTLRRLGLDVNQDPDRVGARVQMEKDWQEVLMDSTKRKRRRKMKKHKLKKRRRVCPLTLLDPT
ncbi:hypothetical protein C8J56DRAFT_956069, partial [Mycena floridula]